MIYFLLRRWVGARLFLRDLATCPTWGESIRLAPLVRKYRPIRELGAEKNQCRQREIRRADWVRIAASYGGMFSRLFAGPGEVGEARPPSQYRPDVGRRAHLTLRGIITSVSVNQGAPRPIALVDRPTRVISP